MNSNWRETDAVKSSESVCEIRPTTMMHLDELQSRLKATMQYLKTLDEKISPVLRPAIPQQSSLLNNGVVAMSPLNDHLCGLLSQVQDIQTAVQMLMDRVDL